MGTSNDILNFRSQIPNCFYNKIQLKNNSSIIKCVCVYILNLHGKNDKRNCPKTLTMVISG